MGVDQNSGNSDSSRSSAFKNMVSAIRWIMFLPAAYVASWIVTQIFMIFRGWQVGTMLNPAVEIIFMQVVSGAALGWVGVMVAPGAKTFALVCCTLLKVLVAVAYFMAFPDFFGGLSAVVGVLATIWAGYLAKGDH